MMTTSDRARSPNRKASFAFRRCSSSVRKEHSMLLLGFLLIALVFFVESVDSHPIISEVAVGPLSGGLPKFVELTNCGPSALDLSQYSLGVYPNDNPNLNGGEAVVLSGTLEVGDSYVINYESNDGPGFSIFEILLGSSPDNFTPNASGGFNGNDAIALFLGEAVGDGSNAALLDVYGVPGDNGGGSPWDYRRGYAFRNGPVTSPTAPFDASEWTIGGRNSLSSVEAVISLTTPGSHVCETMSPTPVPTDPPSRAPSVVPSRTPSVVPSRVPSVVPSRVPSVVPSRSPSVVPSRSPSVVPSRFPTASPTEKPTMFETGLIISEIVTGPLTGRQPRFLELTNCGDSEVDLSQFSVGVYQNGITTLNQDAAIVLGGTLPAGDSYVITYENNDQPMSSLFFVTFGFDADNFSPRVVNGFNGNDAVALFLGAATGDGSDAILVDAYGIPGGNGAGRPWDYRSGYSFRNADVTSPTAPFVLSEWTIGGRNSLVPEGALGNLTTPGRHACVTTPAPTDSPTDSPTESPTSSPTTASPTESPTESPTDDPYPIVCDPLDSTTFVRFIWNDSQVEVTCDFLNLFPFFEALFCPLPVAEVQYTGSPWEIPTPTPQVFQICQTQCTGINTQCSPSAAPSEAPTESPSEAPTMLDCPTEVLPLVCDPIDANHSVNFDWFFFTNITLSCANIGDAEIFPSLYCDLPVSQVQYNINGECPFVVLPGSPTISQICQTQCSSVVDQCAT